MKKNVGSQLISAQMISSTDGSDVTTGTCNVAVEIDGTAGTGGTATHIANGKWEYAPIQADTNGDYLTFQFVLSGAITATVQVYTTFPQTGDGFARLGAPAGASVSADIADVPTVAEFEARTLVAASYFDPATDTVATVTNLTNLPTIPANWLTAAGIAASALDGKGDWNIGKTGYTVSTVSDKTGYSLTATTGLGNQTANITGNLSGSVGSNLELGPAEVAAELATYDGPTNTEMVAAFTEIKGATWSGTDTLEGIYDASGGSTPSAIADAVLDEALSGHTTAGTLGKAIADIETDTNELQTDDIPGAIAALNDPTAAAIADAVWDEAVAGHVGAGTFGATDAAILADTNEIQGLATGATGFAAIDTVVDAILVDTGTTIPAQNIDILVDTAAILIDTADMQPRVAAIEADTNELQSDWADGGRLDLIQDIIAADTTTDIPALIATAQADLDTISDGIITGTAVTGTLSTTACSSDLTGYTNDQLIGRVITFLAGPADGESSGITDYVATNGVITFDALTLAPENGNAFKIT